MSLFYFSLLTLAVFSTASLPLEKLLQKPKLFAAAFSNADPDVIKKMIGLVDRLLEEGEADKDNAVKAHGERTTEQQSAQAAFDAALKAFNQVSADLVSAITFRDSKVAEESSHKAILDAAVKVLNSANAKKSSAKSHMDSTISRVDNEKTALTDVLEKLESVKPTSRRLLNEADPDAVNKVQVEIEKLIKAGEQEVVDAKAAFADASKKQSDAADAEAAARQQHSTTVGELATAEGNVESLTAQKAVKLEEKNSAEVVLTNANSALASALQWMNQEVSRVASEKETLEEVKDLLQKNES